MSQKIINIVFYLNALVKFVLLRPFGNIIHDLACKYNGLCKVGDFRKLERLTYKAKKFNADIVFLKNCQTLSVYPKFICFELPNVNTNDVKSIRKKLLKSALHKRCKEQKQIKKELEHLTQCIKAKLNSVDWYILSKLIKKNVNKKMKSAIWTHEKKLRNLTKNHVLPFTSKEIVSNMSSYKLSDEELDILKNGLSFSIPPLKISKSDVFTSFEMLNRIFKEDLNNSSDASRVKAELSHLCNAYYYNYSPSATTLKKHRILKRLKSNSNIVIMKPDKGNGVVILDRVVYEKSIHNIIDDRSKFTKLQQDVTIKREKQLQRFLRELKQDNFFTETQYKRIYPNGSKPALIYGLPKMHKSFTSEGFPKFRPIVSSIGCYNYNLSKFLGELLSPYINTNYSPKDSFTFVKELKEVSVDNCFLVSFDVESLFTNIPLEETINLAVDTIIENKHDLQISREKLLKLFKFCTSNTHFLFRNEYFEQVDGVAMGSPLAPILANLFMGHHENIWLRNYNAKSSPLFYRRYVDDIFAIFKNETEADEFFKYINSKHQNIKFTTEKEHNKKLPFLDILICKNDENSSFTTSTFRKTTFTGLLTNFLSFTSFSYKKGLIKTLIDRAHKINSHWDGLNKDLKKVKHILQKNLFPAFLVDKIIKNYNEKAHTTNIDESKPEMKFFKLPYIGKYSDITQKKINDLCKKYCKSLRIKIVFTSFKIKNMFSTKDKIDIQMNSNVVYKFICANCTVSYIGETSRNLGTRIKEHLHSDKQSHIYKHLKKDEKCFDNCNSDCFSILDTATTTYQRKIKEALFIQWEQPELNKQVVHYSLNVN